jgi:hypothetical protein
MGRIPVGLDVIPHCRRPPDAVPTIARASAVSTHFAPTASDAAGSGGERRAALIVSIGPSLMTSSGQALDAVQVGGKADTTW